MSNTDSVSRRKFMGSAALASAAVSFPNVLTAESKGKEVIRFALIGCGGRGKGAAAQVMNSPHKTECVALADAFMDTAKGAQNYLKNVGHEDKLKVTDDSIFAGLDAYKKVMEMDNVDLVLLTTSPGFRPLHFEHAVKKGKHVFMEKPVATDGAGVRRVLAANEEAKQKGLMVAVGLQRHHETNYIETVKRIQDGAIGELNYARVFWNSGGVWTKKRTSSQNELEYQVRNWFYFNWLCGDHIVEQHIHNTDIINWIKGSYPIKANGHGGRQVRGNPANDPDWKDHGEIYDHHFVEFEYADGFRMYSQCRHISNCWQNVSEHINGSEGYSAISRHQIFPKSGDPWRYPGQKVGGHQQEQLNMIDALAKGEIYNEGDYGAKSTMTNILGRCATYSGKEVSWDQALTSKIDLCPNIDSLTWESEAPVQPNAAGGYDAPVPGKSRVV
ncbi:MAG: Gfo/Idh/MocA family oxidoreductase [Opitutae bacterium]